jgi:hypothetical protein
MVAILGFRHRRVLWGFAAAAVPLLGVCLAIVGRHGVNQYLALMHASDAMENPGILTNLRGMVGVFTGSFHPAFVIALSVALVAMAALLEADRVELFCVGVVVTQLVSWHGHLYDAVLLLIPLAWMYRSRVKPLRWAATALIVTTPILVARQPIGYLLGIALCGLVAFVWIARPGRLAAAEG